MKKAKRILSILLICCLSAGLLPLSALALSNDTDITYAVEGGNIYFDAETGTITYCDASVTVANIPSEINGVSVTSISDLAFGIIRVSDSEFRYGTDITSITIPASVTYIDAYAFTGCSKLTNITVDSSNSNYKSVDGVLFDKNGENLMLYPASKHGTSYVVPNSVTRIAEFAFDKCSELSSITIPSSVNTIADDAFWCCRGLTNITVDGSNSNYKSIDGVLFDKNGENLILYPAGKQETSYVIPNGVTSIGANAFYLCFGLTSIMIPDSVASIGDEAFWDCSDMKDVYYSGSQAEWEKISIEDGNENLTNATIHYNSSGTGNDSGTAATTPATSGFGDVQSTDYYYDSVKWAVDKGITSGTGANTFSPEQTCTRAQILTFLWRAAGSPEPKGTASFSDVDSGAYYAKAAAWAAEQGMVSGSTFAAETPCARLEAVEYMWKYDGSPASPAAGFADVTSPAVDWAVSEGVTNGTAPATFSPEQTCTRAQIVTFLYRAFA